MAKLLKVLDSVLYKESYSSIIEAYPVTKKMGIASYQVNTSYTRFESNIYLLMNSLIHHYIKLQTLCYVPKFSLSNLKFFSHSTFVKRVNSMQSLFSIVISATFIRSSY